MKRGGRFMTGEEEASAAAIGGEKAPLWTWNVAPESTVAKVSVDVWPNAGLGWTGGGNSSNLLVGARLYPSDGPVLSP